MPCSASKIARQYGRSCLAILRPYRLITQELGECLTFLSVVHQCIETRSSGCEQEAPISWQAYSVPSSMRARSSAEHTRRTGPKKTSSVSPMFPADLEPSNKLLRRGLDSCSLRRTQRATVCNQSPSSKFFQRWQLTSAWCPTHRSRGLESAHLPLGARQNPGRISDSS